MGCLATDTPYGFNLNKLNSGYNFAICGCPLFHHVEQPGPYGACQIG
jgi:hypothetical protein